MVELARKPAVLEVPATVGALGEIAAFVLLLVSRAGLGKGATYRIRLAVDELATNIVMHGYRGADGRITVRGCSGPRGVRIVIEDTAPAFDPVEGRLPPPPGSPGTAAGRRPRHPPGPDQRGLVHVHPQGWPQHQHAHC